MLEPKRFRNSKYLVYPDGQVWTEYQNRFLTQKLSNSGYFMVGLALEPGKTTQMYVHRMVAECFVENPNPKEYDCVNHLDENKHNNHYSNLEWCTHRYNDTYGTKQERWKETITKNGSFDQRKQAVYQYDKENNLIKRWDSMMDIQRALGIQASKISMVCSGKRKTAGGFLWRRCEEVDKD